MRILITSPGGLTGLLLRQPLLSVLLQHGHRLMLAVPERLAALVPMAAPGAETAFLPDGFSGGPGKPDFDARLAALHEQAARFGPELIVAGGRPPEPVEEAVARWFPEVPSVASLDDTPAPRGGAAAPFTRTVPVTRNEPERSRYAALAAAVLGWHVELPRPSLVLDAETRERGGQELARLGVDPAACWVVCAGHTGEAGVRNWKPEQWADLLVSICRRHDLHLLFCGTPDEEPVNDQIRELMGEARTRTASLRRPGLDLPLLAGILSHAAGYIGRQCGPTYVAAALGKPVLTVAGAGDWPRSMVAAGRGAVLLRLVPCAGCGWDCHLSEPYCIRHIPVEEAAAEFDRLVAGDQEFRVRALEPDRFLLHRIIEDAAESARRLKRLSADRIERLERDNKALARALEETRAGAHSLRESVSGLQKRAGELQAALKRSEEELLDREFQVRDLTAKCESWQAEAKKLEKLVSALRQENSVPAPLGRMADLFRRGPLARLYAKLRPRRADD